MAVTGISDGNLLRGKVAFITGAGQGIGLAVARAYAGHGASVVLADIAHDTLERAVATLPDPRTALAIGLDVTDEAQMAAALVQTIDRFGRVDCVVANAGILLLKHIIDLDLASWRRVVDVNLTGAFLTARVFGRQLVSQGTGGRMIFTALSGFPNGF